MQGGATPLFIASQNGHTEVVRLLSCRTSQIRVMPPPCSSHLGVDKPPRGVHLLFAAGADKDIAMQGGANPLFIASQGGHLEVVRLLSDAWADRDIAMQGGATPLFIASQKGHTEAVLSLVSDAGADKDVATQGGATPLFIASESGHLEAVLSLLSDARGRKGHRNAGWCHPLVHRTSARAPGGGLSAL